MPCPELNSYWFASLSVLCPLMVFQYQMQLRIYFTMLSRKSKRFSQCLRRPGIGDWRVCQYSAVQAWALDCTPSTEAGPGGHKLYICVVAI